jgi:hypothetical protein
MRLLDALLSIIAFLCGVWLEAMGIDPLASGPSRWTTAVNPC